MKLILVGGFLGAGKTTLLYHAAKHLAGAGKKVGLITNDQAPDLVDTSLLSETGAGVEEVAGSCFCCNFDGLIDAIKSLEMAGAEVVLAEPVGSCTDLAATIVQPLLKLHPEIDVAPLTVLVAPERLRDALQTSNTGLDPDAVYILQLQLQEADHIVLSKTDTLMAAELEASVAWLREHFPTTPISTLSLQDSNANTSLAMWLFALEAGPHAAAGRHVVPVDYDRYAHGEAVLGWLNAAYDLRWIGGLDADWENFARRFLTEVHDQLREAAAEVGHVKLLLRAGPLLIAANITALAEPASVRVGDTDALVAAPLRATLTFNARAQTTPQTLQDILRKALDTAAYARVGATVRAQHALVPGRPTPTHRFAAATI